MPIFIMAVLALAVFVVMGLMLFYAAYKEAHASSDETVAKVAGR